MELRVIYNSKMKKIFNSILISYRITEDVLVEAGEEYNWVNSLEMVKEMIQVRLTWLMKMRSI